MGFPYPFLTRVAQVQSSIRTSTEGDVAREDHAPKLRHMLVCDISKLSFALRNFCNLRKSIFLCLFCDQQKVVEHFYSVLVVSIYEKVAINEFPKILAKRANFRKQLYHINQLGYNDCFSVPLCFASFCIVLDFPLHQVDSDDPLQ